MIYSFGNNVLVKPVEEKTAGNYMAYTKNSNNTVRKAVVEEANEVNMFDDEISPLIEKGDIVYFTSSVGKVGEFEVVNYKDIIAIEYNEERSSIMETLKEFSKADTTDTGVDTVEDEYTDDGIDESDNENL